MAVYFMEQTHPFTSEYSYRQGVKDTSKNAQGKARISDGVLLNEFPHNFVKRMRTQYIPRHGESRNYPKPN